MNAVLLSDDQFHTELEITDIVKGKYERKNTRQSPCIIWNSMNDIHFSAAFLDINNMEMRNCTPSSPKSLHAQTSCIIFRILDDFLQERNNEYKKKMRREFPPFGLLHWHADVFYLFLVCNCVTRSKTHSLQHRRGIAGNKMYELRTNSAESAKTDNFI